MKLILAALGLSVSLSGCGLILDPRPGDSGEAFDADEPDALDASMDARADALTARDAPALDARDADAATDLDDGGTDAVVMVDAVAEPDAYAALDAGGDAFIGMDAFAATDAARDAFAATDVARDAFAATDAARDAFVRPDAFDPRTGRIEVSAVDIGCHGRRPLGRRGDLRGDSLLPLGSRRLATHRHSQQHDGSGGDAQRRECPLSAASH